MKNGIAVNKKQVEALTKMYNKFIEAANTVIGADLEILMIIQPRNTVGMPIIMRQEDTETLDAYNMLYATAMHIGQPMFEAMNEGLRQNKH